MPAPEQQKEYTRLLGKLQAIGRHSYKELPGNTTSLRMKLKDGAVIIEAYDRGGNERKVRTRTKHGQSWIFQNDEEKLSD